MQTEYSYSSDGANPTPSSQPRLPVIYHLDNGRGVLIGPHVYPQAHCGWTALWHCPKDRTHPRLRFRRQQGSGYEDLEGEITCADCANVIRPQPAGIDKEVGTTIPTPPQDPVIYREHLAYPEATSRRLR